MSFSEYIDDLVKQSQPTEKCWNTGEYTDDCNCEFCSHKYDCSGYDKEGEDE